MKDMFEELMVLEERLKIECLSVLHKLPHRKVVSDLTLGFTGVEMRITDKTEEIYTPFYNTLDFTYKIVRVIKHCE